MSLYELTYCSIASNNLKQKDILKILAKSKEHNKKNNRLFENWNMTYYDLNSKEHEDVNKQLFIDNLINFSQLSLKNSNGVNLFWRLARQLLLT